MLDHTEEWMILRERVQMFEEIYKSGKQVNNYHTLVIDDVKKFAVMIANGFRQMGYRVKLEHYKEEYYHVIVFYDKTDK